MHLSLQQAHQKLGSYQPALVLLLVVLSVLIAMQLVKYLAFEPSADMHQNAAPGRGWCMGAPLCILT